MMLGCSIRSSSTASASAEVLHRPLQGRRRLRVPARRRDVHGLVRAQGHLRHAEPHRPERGRPVGSAPDPGRRHQAVLQGGPASPTKADRFVFKLAPVPLARPRVPRLRDRAHRRRLQRRRLDGVDHRCSATRRFLQVADPPIGILFVLAMSSHRRLRRHARRLVVGLEVPAARVGAGLGPDGVLRGRPRSGAWPPSCCMAGSLSTHDIVASQAESGFRGLANWNLWATGFVPFVDLRHRRPPPS